MFSVLSNAKPLSTRLHQTQESLHKGVSVSFCTSVQHRCSFVAKERQVCKMKLRLLLSDMSLGVFFLSGDITEVEMVRCCFTRF